MKKRFIFLILIAMFCFTLTGCAKVDYTFLNDGTKLTQIFSVELDSDKITQAGINPLEIKSIINEKIISHLNIYQASYESAVNTYMEEDKISVKTANALKKAVTTQSPIWLNNIVTCQITFNTAVSEDQKINYMNVYYLYYQNELYPDIEENEILTEGFLRRVSETDYSVFNSELANRYRTDITTALADAEIDIESDVKYSYTYGTQYRRVHSDADTINYDGTYYLHSWNLENEEEQITIFRIYGNQWIWYVAAASAGIITVVVLLIVSAVKKKKAHQVEVEIITPNK